MTRAHSFAAKVHSLRQRPILLLPRSILCDKGPFFRCQGPFFATKAHSFAAKAHSSLLSMVPTDIYSSHSQHQSHLKKNPPFKGRISFKMIRILMGSQRLGLKQSSCRCVFQNGDGVRSNCPCCLRQRYVFLCRRLGLCLRLS